MPLLLLLLWAATSVYLQVQAQTVFAHFMLGNTENYEYADFQDDIRLAQEAHIDGFALNFAWGEAATDHSMDMMFQAAEAVGFKLIFSFDYAGNGPWPKEDVAFFLEYYTNRPAYFRHHGEKPLVSTFEGPDQASDWHDLKARFNVFFMPSYSSLGAKKAMQKGVADGLFSWAAWPEGANEMDTEVDASYKDFLGGKPYMMPVSPWFFTNMPGFNKNWLWSSNSLWHYRWYEVWFEKPEYVQIISWNDYGESHHIGPVRENAMVAFEIGKSPYNYALKRPHDAWRQFLPFVIDMYKGGAPAVTKEGLTIWYRLNHGRACSTGGTTGNTASQLQREGNPSDFLEDSIMFTALLTKADASVRVKIGNNDWEKALIDYGTRDGNEVGLYYGSVPVNGKTGPVTVEVVRGSDVIVSVAGKEIDNMCEKGISNWNPWVGGAWSARAALGTAIPLSQMGCISGTGTAPEFKKLCGVACGFDYCPPGPCSCRMMGLRKEVPPPKDKEGYPNPGQICSFLGLCSFGCAHGVCPAEHCNQDPVNKGKCFVPPDAPDPTPTSKPVVAPSSTPDPLQPGPWDERDDARRDNAANCFITNPRTSYSEQQCYSYCSVVVEKAKKEGRTTSYGCVGFTPLDQEIPWYHWPFGLVSPDGITPKEYTPGKCSCDNALVNEIADLVIDALPAIAQIGCYIVMSSLRLIVETGLNAIPGVGQGVNAGLKALISAAKTLSYVYDAAQAPIDAFDFWLSPCGGSDLVPDQLKKAFEIASSVADGLVDWKAPKNIGKGSGQKGDKTNPDRDRSPGGNNKDVTVTQVTKWTPKTSTITKVCTALRYPQACYHYYSVEQNYPWIPKHTCSDNHKGGGNRKVPAIWERQHQKNWRKFTSTEYFNPVQGAMTSLACELDEYPPLYFMSPGFTHDLAQKKGQLIRWIPGAQNGGAANTLWPSFCAKNDGGVGNGRMSGTDYNEAVVDLKNKRVEVAANKKTTTEIYEADYTRAVLEIKYDWTGALVPGPANNWGLNENPCWPKAIVPEDPGFVLLTEDKYYTMRSGTDPIKVLREEYENAPEGPRLEDAKAQMPHVVVRDLRDADVGEDGLLVLDDGRLGVREANSSRRLTNEDLKQNIEVLQCRDRLCTNELAELKGEKVGLIVGDPVPALPVRNNVVMSTVTQAPVAIVTGARNVPRSEPSMTMVTKVRYA